MLEAISELKGKSTVEAIDIIENYLRSLRDELEYILTHLDSSNVIELDLSKTTVYEGEENELQQGN